MQDFGFLNINNLVDPQGNLVDPNGITVQELTYFVNSGGAGALYNIASLLIQNYALFAGGDGVLTTGEAQAPSGTVALALFATLDADASGELTVQEVLAGRVYRGAAIGCEVRPVGYGCQRHLVVGGSAGGSPDAG